MGNTKAKNNSNKPKQTGKTVTSVKKQNTVEYVIVNILCLFVFIAFAYIAIMSFVQTSVFDSANYGSEIILYQTDNIALNILFTSLFTVFIFKMKKHCDFFAKVNLKYMHIGLAAFVMIVGLVWIFSVTSVPAADSYNIYETASQAATTAIFTADILTTTSIRSSLALFSSAKFFTEFSVRTVQCRFRYSM